MTMYSSGCGEFEPAVANKLYRGLKLQSDATAVDLTVLSAKQSQSLHLEPGELHSGVCQILSGTLTDVIGYTLT